MHFSCRCENSWWKFDDFSIFLGCIRIHRPLRSLDTAYGSLHCIYDLYDVAKYDLMSSHFRRVFIRVKKTIIWLRNLFIIPGYCCTVCCMQVYLIRVPATDKNLQCATVIIFEHHHQLVEFRCHQACFFWTRVLRLLYGLSDDPSYPSPTVPCLQLATVLMQCHVLMAFFTVIYKCLWSPRHNAMAWSPLF